MAGVTKHPESQYWQGIWYDGVGGKFRRSTKQTARAAALRVAQEWEDLAKDGARGRLTEIQARKVVGDILERVTGERLSFFTCQGWFKEWLAGKKGAVGTRSFVKYEQITKAFVEFLGDRAALTLAAISVRDVRGFRDKLSRDGLSASTVNQSVRKVLSTPFGAAVKLGYITVNPALAVEALRDVAGAERERDAFSVEQVQKLVEATEGDWRGCILMGFYTALRLSDVVNLEWGMVDLEAMTIRTVQRKTGAAILIPIAPDLAEWLQKQTRGIGRAPVFPSLAGKTSRGRSGLSGQFGAIMAKAGVAGRALRAGTGKGRSTSSLSYHSLRHAHVSTMQREGVSEEIRKSIAGHADSRSHQTYSHIEIAALRDAIAKLPVIQKKQA